MMLFLILPPCLVLIISGVVHRSARLGLIAALVTAVLNIGLFILLLVLVVEKSSLLNPSG